MVCRGSHLPDAKEQAEVKVIRIEPSLDATKWSKWYVDLVYHSTDVITAGQNGPYPGACGMEALSWASKNHARLSPVTGSTFSASCPCDLCLCRKSQRLRDGRNMCIPVGLPIPAGQEWIVLSPGECRTVILPDRYFKNDKDVKIDKVEEVVNKVEVCEVEKKEKLTKAAKRKKRKKTLDAFWEQFQ